jgi:hypothetical protein
MTTLEIMIRSLRLLIKRRTTRSTVLLLLMMMLLLMFTGSALRSSTRGFANGQRGVIITAATLAATTCDTATPTSSTAH